MRLRHDNREVADFRTAGIFIRDTACFNCYSVNYDIETLWKHAVYPYENPAIRDSH